MSKQRILLVDDDPSIVKMVGKRLEAEGYEVLIATDGEEALKKVAAEKLDLIILDIMLPKIDGFDVCLRIKRDARYEKIPILMLTAKAQEKDQRLGFQMGADAYMRKPFRTPELLAQMKSLLLAPY